MSKTAIVKVKDPKNAELWLPCVTCNGATCHRVITLVASSDESSCGSVQAWSDYSVVQCSGCKTLSFCIESSFSEDFDYDPYTGQPVLAKKHTLYPNRTSGRPQCSGVHDVPTGVYRIYAETHDSLCNEKPILTGIGIRAVLEAVCTEKSATGKLFEQIDQLSTMGFISKNNVDFLHGLRFLGNKAAHEVKAHSQVELNAAFDIVEHLLQTVYVVPKRAALLPQQSNTPPKEASRISPKKKAKAKSKRKKRS